MSPSKGSGAIQIAAQGTNGPETGTITTKATPASVDKGQPVRLSVDMKWTESDQRTPCPYTPAADPGFTSKPTSYPVEQIRPGHPEDFIPGNVTSLTGTGSQSQNGNTTACGPPNTLTRHEYWDALIPGSVTAGLAPGCYAPYPQLLALLDPADVSGTFATFSVGGDCTTAAVPPGGTTGTDTFTATGQMKPHAVAVPPKRTSAEITLRWAKPSDRLTVAGVVLTPKRKTSSVSHADKLKITFFARTGTSLGVRISNLSAGTLSYRIVATKVTGKATVKSKTVLKA